jgi:hypothetical protein
MTVLSDSNNEGDIVVDEGDLLTPLVETVGKVVA